MTPRWKAIISHALVLSSVSAVLAEPFAQPAFRSLWERTGVPIQRGAADYSWIWGPEPFTPELSEALAEAAGGRRAVQYFDKSRMEINDPAANPNSLWYVTNGLLVNEMVNGQVQVGLNDFTPLAPATIPIAGDPDNAFPTYADLDELVNTPPSGTLGNHATRSFLAGGFGEFAQYANSPAAEIVQLVRGRGVPRAFWSYMNRRGTVYQGGRLVPNQPLFDWVYTLGYPTTEPFWTRVRLGSIERDVLFQAFERRLLTYVPDNPAQYQVEMGNVGRHYYQWRYVEPFAGGEKAIITLPESGALVSSPLHVRGFENGQAFEAAITVRLRNIASGEILARTNTQVARADVAQAGPFTATLTFTPPAQSTPARIEIVTFSPRDGAETLLGSRDVVVGPSAGASPPIAQAKHMLARRLNIPRAKSPIRASSMSSGTMPRWNALCPARSTRR
jgi:hypothetical protein